MANGGIIGTVNNPTSTTATGVWQQEEQYEAKVTDTWPQRALFTTNSCRFNGASDDGLNRTLGTPTNNYKWTISFWLKRTELGVEDAIMTSFTNTQNRGMLLFRTDDQLEILDLQSDSYVMQKKTNRKFRDVSAWYHIVISSDATLASPETKIYVNGVEETSFATTNEYTQNQANKWNSAIANYIGNDSSTRDFSGYLTEFVFVDGQALTPTSFGVANSDGVWTPIPYSGTFGTNGFNLQFENAAALGTDSSSNGNTFTVSNLTSIDQSTDYPENNYATLNAIAFSGAGDRLSEGNLRLDGTSSSAHSLGIGTIAVNQGKWWFEAELDAAGGTYPQIGVRSVDVNNTVGSYVGQITGGAGYFQSGGIAVDGSNVVDGGGVATYTTGDIINVGLDLDNNKIYWYKNGTIVNSGGTTITNRFYTFAVSQYSNTGHWFCNFGAGTIYSISSGNTDGNGYGNFEYAVPSGYYSLNTKNLAEFG